MSRRTPESTIYGKSAPPSAESTLQGKLTAVAEARARILQRLADLPDGGPLGALLPEPGGAAGSDLRRRSAWSSTSAASLELARQGDVVLAQDADFQPIHVGRA